jgi:Gpi18-like mannosyltransferase
LSSLAIVPLLPTVILNSSYLSQCDSIYATFVIASLYFILKDRQFLSALLLGIAFAFKMQTAIILPVFFVFMLRKKINWYYFLLIPAIFTISILPTWFYGRNFSDLFEVYLNQSNRYPFLTLNFPNIYIWIDNAFYEPIKFVGLLFTTILTIVCGFVLSNKKYNFSFEQWIRFAFLSSIIIPFILPGMHERYMYLGDILGVLYFLVLRKNIYLPIAIASVSFYSYIRCSRYNDILPMSPAFVIYVLAIILITTEFIINLKNDSLKN